MANNKLNKISEVEVYNIDTKEYQFTLRKYKSNEQSVNIWEAVDKNGNLLAEKKFMEHSKIEQIRFAFKKELKMI